MITIVIPNVHKFMYGLQWCFDCTKAYAMLKHQKFQFAVQ